MTLQPTRIILVLGTALVSTATINSKPAPVLIWNATQSVPIGLYRVQQADQLTVTDLVIAMPEGPLADFLAERGCLPLHVPLIKRILAVPGQTICRNHLTVMVDGIEMGAARERDHRGLPTWDGCRTIAQGEVFLMNWTSPCHSTAATSVRSDLPRSSAEHNLCGPSRDPDHAARLQSKPLRCVQFERAPFPFPVNPLPADSSTKTQRQQALAILQFVSLAIQDRWRPAIASPRCRSSDMREPYRYTLTYLCCAQAGSRTDTYVHGNSAVVERRFLAPCAASRLSPADSFARVTS
jgi:type IV secretory pathway protease TraF